MGKEALYPGGRKDWQSSAHGYKVDSYIKRGGFLGKRTGLGEGVGGDNERCRGYDSLSMSLDDPRAERDREAKIIGVDD